MAGDFHSGDFVQTSRRSQFHSQRTSWHDLQGRHCPRFNVDATVAVPIPKPKDYDQLDEYKIQFAFDHERLFSSWLTILAKPNSPGAGFDVFHPHKLTNDVLIPFVRVRLWKREDALLRVTIEGSRLPDVFMKSHPDIVEEYKNREQWPKHVLVKCGLLQWGDAECCCRYEWSSMDEVDAERGMMVLIYGGMMVIFTMMFAVVLTSKAKLTEFFRELATEGLQMSGKEESKAE